MNVALASSVTAQTDFRLGIRPNLNQVLLLIGVTDSFGWSLSASAVLGVGAAMVYPTLIAAVSDVAHPTMRARAPSVYRFWRDLGYAAGALSSGLLADFFGFEIAILATAVLTLLSGAVFAIWGREGPRR
jgi:MFS family permease